MLLQKLSYLTPKASQEEIDNILKLYGMASKHAIPTNFKEVDEEWMATRCLMRMYSPTYMWWSRIKLEDKKYDADMHFFGFYDGTGFAMYHDYNNKRMRYFSFAGCIHEFRQPTKEECDAHHDHPGRCYHVSICDKCGYWKSVDTSD
jgi:hypothetical protein